MYKTFYYAWELKHSFPIPNPLIHFQFLVLVFVSSLWRLILYLCLWICVKLWGWSFQLWTMVRLGLRKVIDWILTQICKVKRKVSLLITLYNLLFHLSILGVFFLCKSLLFQAFCCSFASFFHSSFARRVLKRFNPPHNVFNHSKFDYIWIFKALFALCIFLFYVSKLFVLMQEDLKNFNPFTVFSTTCK